MPATATHAFFAKDIYDILPDSMRNKLDLNRCKMFGQSVDSLMFYNLFSILPGKDIRKFQYHFHNYNTQGFFINLLKYIKENNVDDIDTNSFLFGFICHFVLDSTLHPYIIYKTGKFDKNNPRTYKYNNIHAFMESFIDMDMINKRMKTNPYKFNVSNFCFDLRPFSNDLCKAIDYAFYNTYGLKNMSQVYYKSLKQMRMSINVFRRDSYGIKKFIYKLADSFTADNTYRFEAISYHVPLDDRHNYLNMDNKLWRHPINYDDTSCESFIDLYLKAINAGKVMYCASCDYLNGKSIDLTKIFPDIKYTTGLECSNDSELKYFAF